MIIDGTILSLDLATNTGWCCGAPNNANPDFGHHVLPSSGDDIGAFANAFCEWLKSMLDLRQPSLVIFEMPILPKQTNPTTVRKLMGLAVLTELMVKRRKIACREGRASSVKKYFAGTGRAKKDDTKAMCRRYGWNVRTDDEADACALWAYAVCCYAPDHAERFALGGLNARPMF